MLSGRGFQHANLGVSPLKVSAILLFCKTSNLAITIDWSLVRWLVLFANSPNQLQSRKPDILSTSMDCFDIFTARKRSCGKVMFSVVSVILFTQRSHVTITHNAFDLTIQGPPPWPCLPDIGPYFTGTPQPPAPLPAFLRHGASLYRNHLPPNMFILVH